MKTNFLQKYIQGIPLDKKEHLILGVLTGFPLVLILGNIGGIVALLLYASKEVIYDGILNKGTPSFLDWWWNSIPILQYLILINLL